MQQDTAQPAMALRGASLDPQNWAAWRALGHRMLDDCFDNLAGVADGPVWQPMPDTVRAARTTPLPREPASAEQVYAHYRQLIEPYAVGNRHPRFLGWVHGGGTAIGGLAEMLAGFLNANCGGRDHAPIAVERQVIAWAAELLGLPESSSGLLLGGSSMANFAAILVARTAACGPAVRETGALAHGLVGYTSQAAHLCVGRGFDMAGLGSAALRLIPHDAEGRMRPDLLRERIAADRQAGLRPFLLVATAGSVDIGAIDDLPTLARICALEGLWLHVDAALGAMAALSPQLAPRLTGIERADSVAFDFHKWAQAPYDCGCLLVRDPSAQLAAFARDAAYLARSDTGLAAGTPWPVDLGPELSRGFRALKVWMTLSVYGTERLGEMVAHCVALATAFAAMIDRSHELERAAPVPLNIVCFRLRGLDDAAHLACAAALQLAGEAVFSTTRIDGRVALRAAFVNHRTSAADLPLLLETLGNAAAGFQARAASINARNCRTTAASPVNTASPMMKWPMFSSTTCAMDETADTLS